MRHSQSFLNSLVLAGVVCSLALSCPSQAQVTVSPSVVFNGAAYHYDYSVANNSLLDVSLVTINVAGLPGTVQNLQVPNGFTTQFDPNFGTVDFSEQTSGFAPGTTLSGFEFDSPFAPYASTFAAVALDDATGNLVSFSGPTLAPTAVPEPCGIALALTATIGALFGLRRRNSAHR